MTLKCFKNTSYNWNKLYFSENDVSKEMLVLFNEDDLNDLFKNFNDCFKIRRFIKNMTIRKCLKSGFSHG